MEPFPAIRRITHLGDPLLGPWLDLYQESFPLPEQLKVSEFIRALQRGFGGEFEGTSMLALEREDGGLAGLAWHQLALGGRVLWLFYLAVSPEMRGRGTGARFYHELIERALAEHPELELVVFEVERPDMLQGEEARQAERRIAFYRRLGAKLVSNVSYTQDVGWQPPLRMYLMVHPLAAISEARLTAMLREMFGHLCEPFERAVLE